MTNSPALMLYYVRQEIIKQEICKAFGVTPEALKEPHPFIEWRKEQELRDIEFLKEVVEPWLKEQERAMIRKGFE